MSMQVFPTAPSPTTTVLIARSIVFEVFELIESCSFRSERLEGRHPSSSQPSWFSGREPGQIQENTRHHRDVVPRQSVFLSPPEAHMDPTLDQVAQKNFQRLQLAGNSEVQTRVAVSFLNFLLKRQSSASERKSQLSEIEVQAALDNYLDRAVIFEDKPQKLFSAANEDSSLWFVLSLRIGFFYSIFIGLVCTTHPQIDPKPSCFLNG